MARLFISHSSRDNAFARAFQGWLTANGWDPRNDVFIDFDGIGAGERWRERLRKASAACEAVILLASPASLDSIECQKEIELATALGKEIIIAVIRDLALSDPRLAPFSERQVVDLSAFPRDPVEALASDGEDHRIGFNLPALASIKARLSALGISPGSFLWPPRERPNAEPYPGLSAFAEEDAGIFFGRDADIAAALGEVRLVRRRHAPRLIVIDAASGAGKSSFLRAGLWPRLQRAPEFAPLAILRPSQGLITGPDGIGRRIAPFLARHGQNRAPGSIYAPLLAADEGGAARAFAALVREAVDLAMQVRQVANPDALPPAPLIAIDQAEEMLAAEYSAESERFLAMLAALLKEPPAGLDPYVLLTIRADSVQRLLDRVAALGLETPKAIYLPPLSPAAYREVILRPAEVYSARVKRLEIDPQLVDALVRDAVGADALPLLAFTLARLFGDFAAEGRLAHAGYVAMGGVAGSIARALRAALTAAGAVGEEEHLRRLMVPALVTWDPDAANGQGAAKRLPAPEDALLAGPRAQLAPLAQALVDVRLLHRDRDSLEVAHEALLRLPPISDWLEEDREFLVWRDRTAKARASYEAKTRGLLDDRELPIAVGWLKARGQGDAAEIGAAERSFIEASLNAAAKRARDTELQRLELEAREQAAELKMLRARDMEAQARAAAARRAMLGILAGLVSAMALAVVAYWQWREAVRHQRLAQAQSQLAEEQGQKEREASVLMELLFARDPAGMLNIGRLYEDGQYVTRDYAKARAWYEKAATLKYPGAMRALGVLYASGRGVPQDDAKADYWFAAAAADNVSAMVEIGQLYAIGEDVPRSIIKARQWLEKAAAAGDKDALVLLSWHALLAREFAEGLDAAERALKAGPGSLWIERNRAHALMLLDRAAEAREVHLAHQGKRTPGTADRTWQQEVAYDFARLRKAGIEHPQMAEIEVLLGIAKR